MTEPGHNHESVTESEFYAEPAKLTRKDAAGVVIALLALAVIGLGGYVWLNPNLSVSGLLARQDRQVVGAELAPPAIARGKLVGASSTSTDILNAPEELVGAANADRQAECPQCGMVAGASEAEVVAQFADGSVHHFDSWICVFGWSKASGQAIADAVAMADGSYSTPRWLKAADSVFLYDTKRIPGSMPPYVAAFATEAEATAGQTETGGQVVRWSELQQRFTK
jgi:nitrous oxide reductase accessory protein NosL